MSTPVKFTSDHLAQWRREAEERIVVRGPQGVDGTGDATVVIVGVGVVEEDGRTVRNPPPEFEIARFSTWAALVTGEDRLAAAEAYAVKVRQRYVNLATGIPGFGTP